MQYNSVSMGSSMFLPILVIPGGKISTPWMVQNAKDVRTALLTIVRYGQNM